MKPLWKHDQSKGCGPSLAQQGRVVKDTRCSLHCTSINTSASLILKPSISESFCEKKSKSGRKIWIRFWQGLEKILGSYNLSHSLPEFSEKTTLLNRSEAKFSPVQVQCCSLCAGVLGLYLCAHRSNMTRHTLPNKENSDLSGSILFWGSRVVQQSKALQLSARGITRGIAGSIPGCITTSRDWKSHRAAHNWPSIVQVRGGVVNCK